MVFLQALAVSRCLSTLIVAGRLGFVKYIIPFQILTKRPERIADHLPADWGNGWPNVWLGVSIERDDYVWRADVLRTIPAAIRFISAEPLLAPLPSLNLDGIQWLIVGGESGPGWRPMETEWVRQLRDRCRESGTAFFHKQSAGYRTEMGIELDGEIIREYPESRRVPLTLF